MKNRQRNGMISLPIFLTFHEENTSNLAESSDIFLKAIPYIDTGILVEKACILLRD